MLSSSTTSPLDKHTITLSLEHYDSWSFEELSALMVSSKKEGGVGLSFEHAKVFHDSGFNGQALCNLAKSMKRKRGYGVTEEDCIEHATHMMLDR